MSEYYPVGECSDAERTASLEKGDVLCLPYRRPGSEGFIVLNAFDGLAFCAQIVGGKWAMDGTGISQRISEVEGYIRTGKLVRYRSQIDPSHYIAAVALMMAYDAQEDRS